MEHLFRSCRITAFKGYTHVPGIFTEDFRFFSHRTRSARNTALYDRKVMINVGSVGQPRMVTPGPAL